MKPVSLLLLLASLLMPLPLLAATPEPARHPADPWEGFNRKVFAFNETVDRYFLKPTAKGYRWITPGWLDNSITRVFQNAKDLTSIVSHVLQWEWGRAGNSTGRVLMNTSMGIGGLFDVATPAGLEKRTSDLGITLARWGVPSGPYLVLPLLGPSTVRDASMIWPEDYISPRNLIDHDLTRWSVSAVYVVDLRADLLDLEKNIVGERYSFMRDFYLSSRRMEAGEEIEDDFSADFEEGDWGDDDW